MKYRRGPSWVCWEYLFSLHPHLGFGLGVRVKPEPNSSPSLPYYSQDNNTCVHEIPKEAKLGPPGWGGAYAGSKPRCLASHDLNIKAQVIHMYICYMYIYPNIS